MKMRNLTMVGLLSILLLLTACNDGKMEQFNHAPEEFFNEPNVIELALAALNNNEKKVEELMQQGIDINYQGKDGMTPLLWVLGQQNKQGFNLLLRLGADPNMPVDTGGSVMTFAAGADDPVYLQMALANGGDPNYFHRSRKHSLIFDTISPGRIEHIKLLVKHGADINATDALGDVPIMTAASLNQYDIVYFLLEQGADFKRANRWGKTIKDVIENNSISKSGELYKWRGKVIQFLHDNGVEVSPRID
ncbi:hypothetical protein N5094_01105 [Shewanella putrefaciens]|uniref:ankyrin repeat domain-containing protein n=1 Tax=Shewanella putrefaciens TaxID=24 RepID=UPI0021C005A7|nr:ankyrin repeat domain-containing protein [Shewanella putrefaciens]UXK08876.1 hypothetical protein N5094_01105 [Shewanella putrefaciens]